jgi:formate/nitrite transporter
VEIVDEVIDTYSHKVDYPVLKSVTLGVLAGAFIALGGYAAALASHSIENVGLAKFVAGAIFPVGLMLILICGCDLFTGNVLVTVPLVDGKTNIGKLLKNWFIIYFSNMLGALIVAFLVFSSGMLDTNNNMLGAYALKVAATKASLPFGKALASGILCNVLVCIAVWMSFAAKDIAGKILAIWFPIMAFIVGGFEHCVANMYYFSIALFAKADPKYVEAAEAFHVTPEKLSHISFTGIVENLIPVTIGNIIGGGIFIGVAFWFAFKYTAKNHNAAKASGKESKAV